VKHDKPESEVGKYGLFRVRVRVHSIRVSKAVAGENMTVALQYDIFMSKAYYSKNKLFDYK
jgi:hypothetical protein